MKAENYEKLKEIADSYGYEKQSRQYIEEAAELTKAINKKWRLETMPIRTPSDDVSIDYMTNQLIEEIADVEICLEQLKYLLKCNEKVEQIKDFKINREVDRIEEVRKKLNEQC